MCVHKQNGLCVDVFVSISVVGGGVCYVVNVVAKEAHC